MSLHQTLETYIYRSALRRADSRKKILLATAALFITAASGSPILPASVLLVMTALTVGWARIPWRAYVKALSAVLGFTLPAIAVMIWLEGGLRASGDGAALALLTISKVLGGSSGLFFLAFTTPSAEIFGELRRIGVPPLFTELAAMIYRYIFILMDEAGNMHSAQTLRLGNGGGVRRRMSSLGMLSATLFVRSMIRGQRVFHAMEARGFKGTYPLEMGWNSEADSAMEEL